MSCSEAIPASAERTATSDRSAAIRPAWLRPMTLALVVAFHATLLLVVKSQPSTLTPLDAIDVTLEPQGDSPVDQQKVEEVKPAEAPPPPPQPPVEHTEVTAPPPQIVAPEAIPLPVEKPKPLVEPKPKIKRVVVPEEDDRPTPAELRAQARKRAEAAERREARAAQLAARRGSANGSARAAMSRGSYAGLLAAELRRHQFYPSAARAEGATGSVGVAFTVGSSGRVVRQAIISSSGNASLDGAARAMMSAVHTPPPPGGSFSTSTTIHFHLD